MKKTALAGIGTAIFPAFGLQDNLPETSGMFGSHRPVTRNKGLKLWYQQPAQKWMAATPIGNGRLAAMVFGGVPRERVALNEITMWVGQPDPDQEPDCGRERLEAMRELFFRGKLVEGNQMAQKHLAGKPNTFGTHIPVGDLSLQFDHDAAAASEYRRELDIARSVMSVSYKLNNVRYTREYFCSNPDDIMLIKLSASRKRSLNFTVSLELLSQAAFTASGNRIDFSGKASSTLKVGNFPKFSSGGVDFAGAVQVALSGGTIEAGNGTLTVTGAHEAVLMIDIRTSYKAADFKTRYEDTIQKAAAKKYETIKSAHIRDYATLFDRVDLQLGADENDHLPSDKRWMQYNEGKNDPAFCALYFQYNRYLLISCSRENSPLPANLQGIWNDNLAANMPWTCDYHLDINTQQNYWAANVANLAECNNPLFTYTADLAEHGARTAEKVYGSRGWVAHTVANVWGYTAPGQSTGWGLFPTASTWLALHMWEHYKFTGDVKFLRDKAYPILKKNAEFFINYMTTDPESGYLMTGPSTSPENGFLFQGTHLALSMMPTCDRVFVYELFDSCVRTCELLDIDAVFRDSLKNAIKRLPPLKISKNGELQEWFEDYEKAMPNHRHTTHLVALYPYNQISPVQTPGLAAAAAKTIQYRLEAQGWEDVEWSRANMINFFARLKEAQKAHESINILLKDLSRENLFTISVAGIAGASEDIFAFDGNQGAAAGIAEMLVQSHEDYIEFLPALPQQWATGSYNGLCVRGGATVSATWKNMQIEKASLWAQVDNAFRVRLPETGAVRLLKNGSDYPLQREEGNIVQIAMQKGDRLEIQVS